MPSDILIPQSTTSQIRHFMLRSATTGQGVTGKTHSDFSGKYNINGGTEVTLSFSAGTVGDAYSSGKIVPLGLGKYAWHVPDTLFGTAGSVSAVLACADAIDVHFDWTVAVANRAVASFGANTVVPPTVAEFEARSLPSADYFVVGDYTAPTNLSAAQVRTELETELARIDVAISTRSTFAGGAVASVTAAVTVGTNNDKTGYALTQAFPANFAALAINVSGHPTDVPTVAAFNARTLLSAEYFVVGDYTAPPTTDQIWGYFAGADDTVYSQLGELKVNVEDVNTKNTLILEDTDETIPGLIAAIRGADSDTLKTLSDQIDTISSGGGSLTQGDIDAIVAAITAVANNIQQAQAGILTAYEYTTWSQDIEDLVVLTGNTDIIFVLKRRMQDADAQALLKVSRTTGLMILNGVDVSSSRSGEASITVNQATPTGEITLLVDSTAMAEVPRGKWIDGLKMLHASGDVILRQGTTIIRESAVDETS